jgi:hypothetical protein
LPIFAHFSDVGFLGITAFIESALMSSSDLKIPESAYQLGELREDFRFSSAKLAVCLGVVVLLLSIIGWLGWTFAPFVLGIRNVLDFAFTVAFLGIFLFVGGWVVLAFYKIILNRHMHVLIFDEGLVAIRMGEVFVARWDEIERVRDEVIHQNKAMIQQCTICLRSGKTFVLSNLTDLLADYERLVATIVEQADTRRLPEALADLEAGRLLDFGGLQLSPEGIHHGEHVLPWAEVGSIMSDPFRVSIARRDALLSWAIVPSGQLHNRFLLKTLVYHFKDAAQEPVVV